MYGRLEGFEHYLESMFGPKGPLNSEKLKEKISNIRFSRSVSDNEVLKSEIDSLPNVMENTIKQPKVCNRILKVFTFNVYDIFEKYIFTETAVNIV